VRTVKSFAARWVRSSEAATGCRFGMPMLEVYSATASAVFAMSGPTMKSTPSCSTSLCALVSEVSGLPASSSTIVSIVMPLTVSPLRAQ